MKKFTVQITDDIRALLKDAEVKSGAILLTCGRLPPDTYKRFNSVMVAAGGKWDKKIGGHRFSETDAADALRGLLIANEVVNESRKDKVLRQAFYTDPYKSDLVADYAEVNGKDVLEPSAGRGGLAEACLRSGASSVDCIEIDPGESEHLRSLGLKVTTGDFLKLRTGTLYERVVMNPPFCRVSGIGKQDIAHIRHARDHWLCEGRHGGSLVSIVPGTPESRKDLFDSDLNPELLHQWKAGDFKDCGTNVINMLIKINRC